MTGGCRNFSSRGDSGDSIGWDIPTGARTIPHYSRPSLPPTTNSVVIQQSTRIIIAGRDCSGVCNPGHIDRTEADQSGAVAQTALVVSSRALDCIIKVGGTGVGLSGRDAGGSVEHRLEAPRVGDPQQDPCAVGHRGGDGDGVGFRIFEVIGRIEGGDLVAVGDCPLDIGAAAVLQGDVATIQRVGRGDGGDIHGLTEIDRDVA